MARRAFRERPTEVLMRISRLATGTSVLVGIAIIAANPGCSSTSGSGFPSSPDAGLTELDGGLFRGPDGTIINPGHDAQTMLMGGPDSSKEGSVSHEAGFNDAKVMVDGESCVADAGPVGPGPVLHTCIIYPAGNDSGNECDEHHDPPAPFPANGSTGNGFDDNCNGLVDEGCSCTGVGTTKPCYLVPASQTVNGVPVGWCTTNSKGTVNCQQQGEAAPTWSGVCRGAQPPYAEDVCSPGDFNCDGKPENPTGESCACKTAEITCPTAPLTTVPYPPPTALPLEVNAADWFSNPADVSMATDWSWNMTGGDCDNILPYPTFALYPTKDGSGDPADTLSKTLGMGGAQHGVVSTSAITSATFPAFSLSGSYVLTGSWMLGGKPYSCTVQIAAQAPGLRAEGCWDTVAEYDDLDLHMAKVNGFSGAAPDNCTTTHAWSDLACENANEDCFYGECSSVSGGGDSVDWGFPSSPASACTGWGSQSTGNTCGNPRLDRDANGLSGQCDPTVLNPNTAPSPFSFGASGYCGAENINLDAPASGDQYAVGLRFYGRNGTATGNAHVHADIYCNGVRIFAAGYEPVASPPIMFPQLATPGQDSSGDMWKVALVTTTGTGSALTCTVVPTNSTTPDLALDGSSAYCVDDATANGAKSQEYLTNGGGVPASGNALCFH